MIAPEPSTLLPAADDFPEGCVEAGVYQTAADGLAHGAVVLAMGEACWLITTDAGHHLHVTPDALNAVRQQLACFDRESVGWPPRPFIDAVPARKHLPLSPWLWVLGVFIVFGMQEKRHELTDTALMDARRVFEYGEWWRPASALWLHADIGHLVSNAGSGLLVFSAVVATLGFRAGWGLLAAAAIAGNLAAAAILNGSDYRSLGASTAVFAGLGLLTGRAVRVMSRSGHPHRWRTLLTPLFAGVAVLGLFGAGGVNVDVLAHATGFAAGLAFGFIAGGAVQHAASGLAAKRESSS